MMEDEVDFEDDDDVISLGEPEPVEAVAAPIVEAKPAPKPSSPPAPVKPVDSEPAATVVEVPQREPRAQAAPAPIESEPVTTTLAVPSLAARLSDAPPLANTKRSRAAETTSGRLADRLQTIEDHRASSRREERSRDERREEGLRRDREGGESGRDRDRDREREPRDRPQPRREEPAVNAPQPPADLPARPVTTAEETSLPAGWSARTSTRDGSVYYYNSKLDESVWSLTEVFKTEEAQRSAIRSTPTLPTIANAAGLPARPFDPATGRSIPIPGANDMSRGPSGAGGAPKMTAGRSAEGRDANGTSSRRPEPARRVETSRSNEGDLYRWRPPSRVMPEETPETSRTSSSNRDHRYDQAQAAPSRHSPPPASRPQHLHHRSERERSPERRRERETDRERGYAGLIKDHEGEVDRRSRGRDHERDLVPGLEPSTRESMQASTNPSETRLAELMKSGMSRERALIVMEADRSGGSQRARPALPAQSAAPPASFPATSRNSRRRSDGPTSANTTSLTNSRWGRVSQEPSVEPQTAPAATAPAGTASRWGGVPAVREAEKKSRWPGLDASRVRNRSPTLPSDRSSRPSRDNDRDLADYNTLEQPAKRRRRDHRSPSPARSIPPLVSPAPYETSRPVSMDVDVPAPVLSAPAPATTGGWGRAKDRSQLPEFKAAPPPEFRAPPPEFRASTVRPRLVSPPATSPFSSRRDGPPPTAPRGPAASRGPPTQPPLAPPFLDRERELRESMVRSKGSSPRKSPPTGAPLGPRSLQPPPPQPPHQQPDLFPVDESKSGPSLLARLNPVSGDGSSARSNGAPAPRGGSMVSDSMVRGMQSDSMPGGGMHPDRMARTSAPPPDGGDKGEDTRSGSSRGKRAGQKKKK